MALSHSIKSVFAKVVVHSDLDSSLYAGNYIALNVHYTWQMKVFSYIEINANVPV